MYFSPLRTHLTHWGRHKMAAVSQTTLSNAFSWMKMLEFRLRFHWSLFLRFELTIFQHWLRLWLVAGQATSHYLNQWWLVYWRICVTRPQWVKNKKWAKYGSVICSLSPTGDNKHVPTELNVCPNVPDENSPSCDNIILGDNIVLPRCSMWPCFSQGTVQAIRMLCKLM